jgi:GR25 family glycosyltransferase involved in LPS biosynthesis
MIPTLVINLDRDHKRLERLYERLNVITDLNVRRVPGLYGKDLPDAACTALTRSKRWGKGEIGCFISHVKAWEAAAECDVPCLVLEDDAVPHGLERIHHLLLPADADLVFVNNRTSLSTGAPEAAIHCVPIVNAVRTLNVSGKGVGGDGYILTPVGARKLLDAVSADLFFGHVDWRMLRYSLRPSDLAGELAGTRCDHIIRHHHNPTLQPQWGVVNAWCLDNALVTFPIRHTSTRLEANIT